MPGRPRLAIASQNPGKCREIARILDAFETVSLADLPAVEFPEEGGDYLENAIVKARTVALASALPAVADDSGLEVDFLGGAPGPYSARYGGPGLDDAGRVAHLLEALKQAAPPRRARFRCVAACVWPDGRSETAEGVCEGEIAVSPRGDGGFGYDPVFVPEGGERAMAELERAEKDGLSHRGRAFRALRSKLVAEAERD